MACHPGRRSLTRPCPGLVWCRTVGAYGGLAIVLYACMNPKHPAIAVGKDKCSTTGYGLASRRDAAGEYFRGDLKR